MCGQCFGVISRGISHPCNKIARFHNVNSILDSSSNKSKDQVLSTQIKKKVEETGNGPIKLSQRNGKPINLSMDAKESKKTIMSVDDVLKIQSNIGLTRNETLEMATMFRQVTQNRKLIEPHLKEKLSGRIHAIDNFFALKLFDFINIKASKVTDAPRYAVYCNNLNGLIQYVLEQRQVTQFHLKIGIDGGGGSLKISLSIQSTDEDELATEKPQRQSYDEGIASKRFRDSGVKKTLHHWYSRKHARKLP